MNREMVMPILFGIILILLTAGYGALFFLVPIPWFIKAAAGVMVIAIAVSMIYVLIQRSRELKEESKDDLSKY